MDNAWSRAVTGLRCIAFIPDADRGLRFSKLPRPGEITAVEEDWVWVVLDGEEVPRRVFWTDIRPRA